MKREKPEYSLWSNTRFNLRFYWETAPSVLAMSMVSMLMQVGLPFIGILLPKVLLDLLAEHAAPSRFVMTIGMLSLLMVLLHFLQSYTRNVCEWNVGTVGILGHINKRIFPKNITMDYEVMEDPAIKPIKDKLDKSVQSNHSPSSNMPREWTHLLTNMLGFLLYGGVIATVHPLIILLLIASGAISAWALSAHRVYELKTREDRSVVSRKIQYLNGFLNSRTAAKDMRLYNMIDWLIRKQDAHFAESDAENATVAKKRMNAKLIGVGLILLRDGAAYAFLIYLFFQGQITLGNFIFVFAAIGAFAGWVSGIITSTNDLLRSSSEISDIRRYLDLADRMRTGPGHKLPQGAPPAISLRGVSYRYPEAENFALKDIDLEIAGGESIAIVGTNGAGKTTLVKLLCGLYQPTEGEIRMDGIDIGAFNRDEYFTLFSTVFQDIHLLSSSIAHNVSQTLPQDTDDVRVACCLQLAGLWEKVQSLPGKADTLLVREINAEGLDLSGGEKQKLAMARALYKDAPVMILDEPTAALDPIAENQVYQQYAELTRGKTSVYISHRLASTRFCDRIVLLDGQHVKEVGTHDELMALGGLYTEMFSIQAHYYSSDKEAMEHVGA